jgi:DnaJ-class molecular chaperone
MNAPTQQSAAPAAFRLECCYLCHGCGSVARDMYGPGGTVVEHDERCSYCNGKGTVVVERRAA